MEGGGGNPDEPGWGLAAAEQGQGWLPNSEHVEEQKPALDSLKSADGNNQGPSQVFIPESGGAGSSPLWSADPSTERRGVRLETLCAQVESEKEEF